MRALTPWLVLVKVLGGGGIATYPEIQIIINATLISSMVKFKRMRDLQIDP